MGLQNQWKSKLCPTVIDSEMNHSQQMQHDARVRGKLIYSNGVSVIACCMCVKDALYFSMNAHNVHVRAFNVNYNVVLNLATEIE